MGKLCRFHHAKVSRFGGSIGTAFMVRSSTPIKGKIDYAKILLPLGPERRHNPSVPADGRSRDQRQGSELPPPVDQREKGDLAHYLTQKGYRPLFRPRPEWH